MRRLSVVACIAVCWTVGAFAAQADTRSGSAPSTDRVLDRVFARAPGEQAYANFAPRLANLSPWAFGVNFGIQFPENLPLSSTQGFYTNGDLDGGAAGGIVGVSGFYDLWTGGTTAAPFGKNAISVGVVIDWFGGAGNHVKGLCGGFPCDGAFRLDQFNVIGEVKWTTWLTDLLTFNLYVGLGPSFAWASGQPTGPFGPQAHGDDTALAVRVGGGFSQQTAPGVTFDFKTGYQWTGEFVSPTDFTGEQFRTGVSGVLYTTVGFTYRPSVASGFESPLRRPQRNF